MSRSCIQKSTCIFAITSLFLLYMAFGQATSAHASSLTPARANLPQRHQDDPKGWKGSPRALSICSTFIILAVDGKNSSNLTVNVNRDFELELEKNANCIVKISGKGYHHRYRHGMMMRGGWMKSDPSDMNEQSSSMPDASQAPNLSQATEVSQAPNLSQATEVSQTPNLSQATEVSQTPNLSQATEVSQAPNLSQATEVSQAPSTTYSPEMNPNVTMR